MSRLTRAVNSHIKGQKGTKIDLTRKESASSHVDHLVQKEIRHSEVRIRLGSSHLPHSYVRNPGRDISFPIFIRKEIETRKLERKSKQKISRLIDLLYRLNDIISSENDIK